MRASCAPAIARPRWNFWRASIPYSTCCSPPRESGQIGDAEVEALVQARNEAKKARNFALLRPDPPAVLEQGIILEDTKSGMRWKRKSS